VLFAVAELLVNVFIKCSDALLFKIVHAQEQYSNPRVSEEKVLSHLTRKESDDRCDLNQFRTIPYQSTKLV